MILSGEKHEIAESPAITKNTYLHEAKVVCDFCGAVFRMVYVKQKGNNNERIYHCPECAKRYFVLAAATVADKGIILISGRTDGKTVKYRNIL